MTFLFIALIVVASVLVPCVLALIFMPARNGN